MQEVTEGNIPLDHVVDCTASEQRPSVNDLRSKSKMESYKKRTWHYVQNPKEYEITCDRCNGSNIEWSEYQGLIWCYDCKIDTKGTSGVFDGPIPIQTAALLGMCFDRWDMIRKRILTWDKEKKKYVPKDKK